MRIALVAPFGLRAKGTARARALPLAHALARLGHTVALFIPPYDSPQDSGVCWIDEGVSVTNVRLPRAWPDGAQLRARGAVWHARLARRLLHAVAAWTPDVVHVFKPKGPSGLVGMAISLRVAGAPSAPLVVDADDWEGPGGWNDDPRMAYSVWQRRFFAWQERWGLSHAGAWTVASDCLRQRAIGFGASPRRVFQLPMGLSVLARRLAEDPAPGAPRPAPIPSRRAVSIAAGGGGSGPAGQNVLLYTRFAGTVPSEVGAIWERIKSLAPAATLTVVGRGLAGEESILMKRAGMCSLGWLEPADIPDVFSVMRLAIVPWADTPANRARNSAKVLEMMAAGLPVVAYSVGELPATVGDAGVMIHAGETGAFAAAVADLLHDSDRAASLGKKARARALAEFDWDRLAGIALAAYSAAGAIDA